MAYQNFMPFEGSINGTKTITFPMRTRKVLITNNSTGSQVLKFKLQSSENFGTLSALRSISMADVWVNQVYLDSSVNVDYLVWGWG